MFIAANIPCNAALSTFDPNNEKLQQHLLK